jgi:hypothetical protein
MNPRDPNAKFARHPGTYEARKRDALEFFRNNPNGTINAARKLLVRKYGKAMATDRLGDLRNEARDEQRLPPVGPNEVIKSVRDKRATRRLPPQLEIVEEAKPAHPKTLPPSSTSKALDILAAATLDRKLATIREIAKSIDNLAQIQINVDADGVHISYAVRELRTREWSD